MTGSDYIVPAWLISVYWYDFEVRNHSPGFYLPVNTLDL